MENLEATSRMGDFQLSPKEVSDILRAAGQIYNGYGFFSPDLSNQNLLGISGGDVRMTKEEIEQMISKQDPEQARIYCDFAESYDRLFQRTIDYYSSMLSFDLDISCRNAKATDYKTQEYRDDLNRVYKFLDNFSYKDAFTDVVKTLCRFGVDYTWFRDSEGTFSDTGEIELNEDGTAKEIKKNVYALQDMPREYCMITGKWEDGYLYDVNLNFLLNSGVSILSYDPIFIKYFKDVYGVDYWAGYNPNNPMDKRDGTFSQWHQTSIDDGAFVFLIDSSDPRGRPKFAPMLRNIVTDVEMEGLQRDVNFIAARGILYGEIPRLSDSKSGSTQDQMAWTPATLTKFMTLVKAGLDKRINLAALPTTVNGFAQFSNNYTQDLYSDTLETTASNGASANTLIYSSSKPSEFELKSQIRTDYNMMKTLYNQFNSFMNYFVNKKTRKFKFNFIFSGCNYDFIREQDKKNLLDLANIGIVLSPTAYAKIVDMCPHDFDRMLTEGHYSNFAERLTPLISIHTQSSSDGGRPTSENVSDSTSDYEAEE